MEHGESAADMLDDAVASHVQWQGETFEEGVAAVQEAMDDLRSGRSVSLE